MHWKIGVEVEENHYQLIAFLKIFKELLNFVQVAAGLALLSSEELHALQTKSKALADFYPTAYSAIHSTNEPEQQLLDTASESWW